MAESSESRVYGRGAVVRPLSRAAGRPCSRPGCPSPARATLTFAYGTRDARLQALTEQPSPQAYDLCGSHADRTTPPHGWSLHDDRPSEDALDGSGSVELGGERTVAVLAAALRGTASPHGADADLEDDEDEDPLRAALEELQAVAAGVGRAAEDDQAEDIAVDRDRGVAAFRPRPVLAARTQDGATQGRTHEVPAVARSDAAVLADAVAEVQADATVGPAEGRQSAPSQVRSASATQPVHQGAGGEGQATLW